MPIPLSAMLNRMLSLSWFIENLKVVNTANAEIKALDSLNTKKTAIVRQQQLTTDNVVVFVVVGLTTQQIIIIIYCYL